MVALVAVLVAFWGIWLILAPGKMQIGLDKIWGLASGISAAGSMIYLNLSRQYHDTHTILFFMFGLGAVIMLIGFYPQIFIPNSQQLFYLLLCAGFGIGGQYLLTIGFRYVTAVEGSVISSSRILLAAILGPILVADPALEAAGWLGALLIFTANVVLAFRKVRY
jgi:drug/metabolite transporter (DMT)-like permease